MGPKSSIRFFSENIPFFYRDRQLTRKWIKLVCEFEKHSLEEVNFVFCSDSYLSELNLKFLKHNTFTDILTFPGDQNGSCIVGEIFISVDRVKENSIKYLQDFKEELHRIMIHGILHLLGYKDKGRKEKEEMTRKENEYLALLKNLKI